MMPQQTYPVPPWMFGAVQNTESGGNPNAISPMGAVGPMQVMPTTMTDPGFGVIPARDNSPQEQQRVGNDYLGAMFNRYQGDPQKALMAYNWGPGNVDKLQSGQISPNQIPAETQNYVPKVLSQGTQYAQNQNIQSDASNLKPVTDPELLKQLNGESGMKEVTDPELLAQLNGTRQPDNSNDAPLSALGGVEKGAVGTAMILPNLINQVAAGPQLLGRGIASGVDKLAGIQEQPRGELWQPFNSSEDVLKQLPEEMQPHEPSTPMGIGTDLMGQFLGSIAGGKAIQGAANEGENASRRLIGNNQGAPLIESPSANDVRAASGAAYQDMRNNGATLNRSGINTVTYNIGKSLDDTGLMNDKLHGDTMSVVADLNKDAQSGQMDLEKLDQYRQLLNQVVTKNTSKIDGANPDAYKANVAIHALDDAIDSLGPQHLSNGTPQAIEALNNARSLYSASSKMSDIQRIIDNAKYADVPSTAIKNGFKSLAKQVAINPRGYTPEEVKAINYAASTGVMTGALKFMGSRGIGAITGAIAGGLGGGALGSGAGAMVGGALGFPFRAAATGLQAGRGQNVKDLISQRPQVQDALGINQIPFTPKQQIPFSMAPIAASIPNELEQMWDKRQ